MDQRKTVFQHFCLFVALLLKHADLLCTMADTSAEQPAGTEIRDAGLFARDGVIEQVGPTSSLPDNADQIIDMTGHVVIPGMVNTHHHLFQKELKLPCSQIRM